MTARRPPHDPATSRSERVFLLAAGRDRAQARRTRDPVESTRTLIQAAAPPANPAAEPPRRRIAPRTHARARERLQGGEEPLLDRYALLERLGAGGFGEVWRAYDELLHREVAVKRVWLGADCDSERASREAHASARLSHPAIVRLYEACLLDDAFYLISELVEGETLARLIASDALDDHELFEIGLALTDALAHAHARGVIHRDVKPQNVLIPDPAAAGHADAPFRSAAKLADFGGASLAGEDALTRTGDVLGTVAYMAPEQTEGRTAGEAADLYSLALVMYEALAGFNPVRGATPALTARRIGRPIESLQRRRRDLPRELTRALDRALSRSPRDRGTLADLHSAFAHALDDCGEPRAGAPPPRTALAPRAAPAAAIAAPIWHPGAPPAPLTATHSDTHEQPPPAQRRVALSGGVWLGCALALIAWQSWDGRPGAALLAAAALAPLLLLPREPRSGRLGIGWLSCALAPLLGLLGLAGAYPAIAGQPRRWRERAAFGALGYWWLTLAGALADTHARVLWLAPPSAMPARSVWEGSLSASATHVIAPALTLGVLFGALLWALAALVLPWIVRGRSATVDIVAATVWSAAIAAAAPSLDAGLTSQLTHPSPRGAVLGAVLGGLIAVAARALRGPV